MDTSAINRLRLTDAFLDTYKRRQPAWGFNGLGWIVYARTYSRIKADGKNERWWETVKRVVEGVYFAQQVHCAKNGLPWNPQKAQSSAQKMFDLIFNFKFMPPGRGLWAMGTDYVERRGSGALNNCAFFSTAEIRRDFSRPFTFLMDMSMLGVGVGGDTKGAGTVVICEPSVSADVFVVPDSREGWVESVRVVLESFVCRAKLPKSFDYSNVRPAGTPLSGFGGVASGPEPLAWLHEKLIALLTTQIGQPISSPTIVDIFNMIGRCVVAGGIRRSAEIMLGEPDDQEFVSLKDPTLHAAELESHRWASNNSLFAYRGMDYSPFIDQIAKNGEPGFFWLDNARVRRRMKDPKGDWDMYVMGQNPCGEICLESGEFCNLVEVYPAHHDSVEDFQTTLKWAYLYAKSVSLIPTHDPNTNAIIGRNRRLGVSVSGVAQAITKFRTRPFFDMLDKGYNYLRSLDTIYSKWLCIPQSIKLTTVKPSGTVSLLPGATPGIHFPHSQYYIRNVRFDPYSPLVPVLEAAGYPMEKSKAKDNTLVIGFPVEEQFFSKSKSDVSVWEQFELAAQMQHYWADNAVSVTVTFKAEEKRQLAQILSLYETRLKSVSLLPLENHGYEQAPYIEISQSEYGRVMGKIEKINVAQKIEGSHDIDEKYCNNDVCTIV